MRWYDTPNVIGCTLGAYHKIQNTNTKYVSFAECSLFYRALLQKRPMVLGRLSQNTKYKIQNTKHTIQNTKYVSFAECSLFCRALLQKRPMVLGRLSQNTKYKIQNTKHKTHNTIGAHGVAMISRLLKNMCLFCRM